MSATDGCPMTIYEVQVQGELDLAWGVWFQGLTVTLTTARDPSPTTTLSVPVPDQAALRGLLCKLWDLNQTLVSVRRIGVEA
jgi:hypothetical protein